MKKIPLITIAMLLFSIVIQAQTWNEIQRIVLPVPYNGVQFGYSVSISGDYAAIGAPGYFENGNCIGAVFIYQRIVSAWILQEVITNSINYERFGNAVAIDGNYLVVGTDIFNSNGASPSIAHIYERSGDSWVFSGVLTPSDNSTGISFGKQIAISGDYIVLGAKNDNENGTQSGAVYVFRETELFGHNMQN